MSSSKNNRRTLFTEDAKLSLFRAGSGEQATDKKITLSGYAVVWNVLSSDRGGFRVRFLPGSARFAPNVHALFHHDYRAILGASGNSTLRLKSDDVGVKVEIDLPDTQCARDVAELVEQKYVKGMSFSMLWDGIEYDVKDADTDDEIMEVKSFLCDEVTVTAIPSFAETSVAIADGDDADEDEKAAKPAYARVEQTLRLERLRLESTTL